MLKTKWLLTVSVGAALALVAGSPAAAQERPFAPGEQLLLSLRYLGMNVGELKLGVGQPDVQEGQGVWPLRMEVRTKGIFNAMYGVDERITSFLDPLSGRCVGSDLDAKTGGDRTLENVRFVDGSVRVRKENKSGISEVTKTAPDDARDIVSAIFHLRVLPLLPGDTFSVPIFSPKKSWTLKGTVAKREKVKTPGGTFQTVAVRARTQFGGKLSSDRDLLVWFTDDERRLPVKLEADFAIGSMKAQLTRYQAGELARK